MSAALASDPLIQVGSDAVNPLRTAVWREGDTLGDLSPEQIVAELPSFRPIPDRLRISGNFGIRDDAVTLYFRVSADNDTGSTVFLDSSFTPVDTIRIMTSSDGQRWHIETQGDTQPKALQSVQHPYYVFRIPVDADGTQVILQARSRTTLALPLRLRSQANFDRYSLTLHFLQGSVFGILSALMFYNLFLVRGVRDRSYLYYAMYLGTMIGFQFSIEGYLALFIAPEKPVLVDIAPIVFISLCLYVGVEFARLMANAELHAPRHNRVIKLVRPVFLLPLIPALIAGSGMAINLVVVNAVLATILIVNTLVLSARAGFRHAWFLMLAFCMMVPGIVLHILTVSGIFATALISRHVLQIGTVLEAILLSLLLADRFNQMRNANALVVQKNLKLEKAARITQSRISQKLISTQDAERKRIATELHDGIGQGLALVSNHIQRLMKSGTPPEQDLLNTVRGTIRSMREVTYDLHPHILDSLGLDSAIETTIKAFSEATGIRVTLTLPDDLSHLQHTDRLHLFRIIQESLHNIAKHSAATETEIAIVWRNPDRLTLRIRDNGCGQANQAASGIGLASIRERALALGGHAEFTFSPGIGTVVEVSFPSRQESGDTDITGR